MKHNFFAGPAILPQEVIEKAAQAALKVESLDLSLLELSHRDKFFVDVMTNAERLCRKLLNISDEYGVIFISGGASSQFFMAPMNILGQDQSAAYVNTGTWSQGAIKEAKLYGNIDVVASSEAEGFTYIPAIPSLNGKDYKYLHLTSNNTIFGTQYQKFPDVDIPLVCDMSSDIFSRPLDVNKFDVIYCGAQKNMGTSGCTLVIVKKSILGKVERAIPSMLNYNTHIAKESMYNTPPVFPVYVSMLTMEWVEKHGGVEGMEKLNKAKAKLLYDEIDRNPMFYGTVREDSRSLMNICFKLHDESKDKAFEQLCTSKDIVGITGHRSVGGFRASTYNAMPISSVQVLVDTMQEFERQHS